VRWSFLFTLIFSGAIAATSAGCSHPGSGELSAAPSSAPGPAPPAATDPYHAPARDTLDAEMYNGWKQFSLHCARCHGDDAQGTSFAPSLVVALGPAGDVATQDAFLAVVSQGRPDKGMPSAAKLGLDSVYFTGLYRYLKARSDGQLHGGRPARRDQ